MTVNMQHHHTSLMANTLSTMNLLHYSLYGHCRLERMLLPLPLLRDGGGLGVAEETEGGAEAVGLRHVLVSGGESRR